MGRDLYVRQTPDRLKMLALSLFPTYPVYPIQQTVFSSDDPGFSPPRRFHGMRGHQGCLIWLTMIEANKLVLGHRAQSTFSTSVSHSQYQSPQSLECRVQISIKRPNSPDLMDSADREMK